ncbi:MAG: hypothetical protein RSD95_15975 [Clostridia bacterium]
MDRQEVTAPIVTGTATAEKSTNDSIPNRPSKVKPNALRKMRTAAGLRPIDIVAAMHERYPKYDKSLQSKAERSGEYGIQLTREAMTYLKDKFASTRNDPEKAQLGDGHRNPYRITCRLPKTEYDQLQQRLKRDGRTAQDWMAEQVRRYILDRKEQIND